MKMVSAVKTFVERKQIESYNYIDVLIIGMVIKMLHTFSCLFIETNQTNENQLQTVHRYCLVCLFFPSSLSFILRRRRCQMVLVFVRLSVRDTYCPEHSFNTRGGIEFKHHTLMKDNKRKCSMEVP